MKLTEGATKDTAKKLVIKFFGLLSLHKNDEIVSDVFIKAKKCAIIVCNEIIAQYVDENSYTTKYYKEVKKEIKKL